MLLVLVRWLVGVLFVVVCRLEGVFPSSLWTMFLLSSCVLGWLSFVASCQGLDMLLRWPLCCCLVVEWLSSCSSPTFLLELDICCLAWKVPCVVFCGLLPENPGCWTSTDRSYACWCECNRCHSCTCCCSFRCLIDLKPLVTLVDWQYYQCNW